jgi:hypothetical protein
MFCWHGFGVLIREEAAATLRFKPDGTLGRINAWRQRETLSEH